MSEKKDAMANDSKTSPRGDAVSSEGVKKLAALARLKIGDAELEKFTKEFDSILNYVGQLESLEVPKDLAHEKPPLRNVMREDSEPNKAGTYTEKLTAQFPAREGDALLVKQIISHD